MNVGDYYIDPVFGKCEVLEKLKIKPRQQIVVRFTNTGTEIRTSESAFNSRSIKDPYGKYILGVAGRGYPKLATAWEYKILYQTWQNMLRRVHDPRRHNNINYLDVKICDRWYIFEYFFDDIEHIPGYDLLRILEGKLQLDKDILGNGKLYGPDTCSWVSFEENMRARDTSTYTRYLDIYDLEGDLLHEHISAKEGSALGLASYGQLLKYAGTKHIVNKKYIVKEAK